MAEMSKACHWCGATENLVAVIGCGSRMRVRMLVCPACMEKARLRVGVLITPKRRRREGHGMRDRAHG